MEKKRKLIGLGRERRRNGRNRRNGRTVVWKAASVLTLAAALSGCAAQSDAAQFSAAQSDAAQFSAAQSDAAQFSAAQSDAAWFYAAENAAGAEDMLSRAGEEDMSAPQGEEDRSASERGSVPEFTEEEYRKLEALQWEGYEDMSILAYRRAVAEMTDCAGYLELLERFSKSEAFYARKDSDERASFYFYILEPLTAERYRERTFDGYAMSGMSDDTDKAVLEFFVTLTITDEKKLTVGEYASARAGVTDRMRELLEGRQSRELADEALMRSVIDSEIERLTAEQGSEALQIDVEYVYMPLYSYGGGGGQEDGRLTHEEEQERRADAEEAQERREYPNGTREDYDSLFALMVPGYEDMILSDFNRKLLAWADEDYERAERIGGDVGYHDFAVPLTEEEYFFVTVSANYSHMENAKAVQHLYTGREEDPYVNQDLSYKNLEECGRGAYCGLWYQFSYHIDDRSRITVGERDGCLDGMTSEIRLFWEETEIWTLLSLEKETMTQILQEIAEANSTEWLTIRIEAVNYEKSFEQREADSEQDGGGGGQSERNVSAAYDSLAAYRTDGCENDSVAEFNALLGLNEDIFEAYAMVGDLSPSDENFSFFDVTLRVSLSELYGERFHEPAFFPIYLLKEGRPYYDPVERKFLNEVDFVASVYLEYRISDPKTVTVGGRDRALTQIRGGLTRYVEGLSGAEHTETDIMTELERRTAELIERYAPEEMEISYKIVLEM